MPRKAQNIYEELAAFRHNLELLLEDLALEKQGAVTRLYFDSADVISVVLGLEDFYGGPHFNLQRFRGESALMHGLAYGGWLGGFELLPSHAWEFARLLNLDFGLGADEDPLGRALRFLKDAGLSRAPLLNLSPADAGEDAPLRSLKARAVLAEDLFKAVQSLMPWRGRLLKLLEMGILRLSRDVPKFGFDSLVQSEYFRHAKRGFDALRPTVPVNNLMDSTAVATLVDRLARFKAGGSMEVPQFYSSSPIFREAVGGAGLKPLLSYQNSLGSSSCVLRDADYYIFKVSFRPRPAAGEDDPRAGVSEEYLRDLHEKILWIVGSRKEPTMKLLEKVSVGGVPLNEAIESLRRFSFLENVWMRSVAPQEVSQALSEVAAAAREVQGEGFRQAVAEAIAVVSKRLSENAEEYKRVSTLWLRIEQAAARLRARRRADYTHTPSPFLDFGLLRYGFPESSRRRIDGVLEGLSRGEEDAEGDARAAVLTACLGGLRDSASNLDDLVVASAALLALGLDEELLALLRAADPLPHHSLKIILAEMWLRSRPKGGGPARVVRELENEYGDAPLGSQKRADLAVGIAYLYFRLWRAGAGRPPWRAAHAIPGGEQDESGAASIEAAISHARDAYASLTDPAKKAYALNQYLYYLVEGGGDERLSDMREAAESLAGYLAEPEAWQFRFDDTLARYFHRLALSAESGEPWQDLMRMAIRFIEKAMHSAPWDQEVAYHHTLLVLLLSAGYNGPEAAPPSAEYERGGK